MNKLFDAMMSAKPILYAVDAPNDLVKKYDCGISVPAEDVDLLKNGLLQIMNSKKRDIMGRNGQDAVMQEFTYPVLAKKFLDSIDR